MREKRVAILGGSSGIGLRVAERVVEDGGSVVLGGMANGYTTGSTLYPDGGYTLR